MRRVLVTGFGPFPGVPRNATGEIVEGLCVLGADVDVLVLPVVWWRAARTVIDRARELSPELILMSGVARPRQALWCERGATDRRGPSPDVEGVVSGPFSAGGAVAMTLRLGRAARAARRAIEAHASVEEGGVRLDRVLTGARIAPVRQDNAYVCNHLAFEVAAAEVAPAVGFLHWPSDLAGAHVAAARAVLAAIVASQLGERPLKGAATPGAPPG